MRDRVSERARERALDRLKAGYGAGWLATDTFEARVRTALVPESPWALRGLVEDLTKPRLGDRLRSWHARRRPPLPSPGLLQDLLAGRRVVLIGRWVAQAEVRPGDHLPLGQLEVTL